MGVRKGCLKPALFGCLGLVAILVVIVAVSAVIAVQGVKNEKVTDQEFVAADEIDPTQLPALSRQAGRVELMLAQGEFRLHPGEPDQGVRVKARFDQSSYELIDSLEILPDSTWVYRVEYRRTIPALQAILRGIFGGGNESRVDVFLPPDVPVALMLDVSQGGGEIDLGGLWLTEADLRCSQGGFELDVSEPLHEPLPRLDLSGNMGGFEVRRLGNASPQALSIDVSMGGGEIDLSGAWRNGSTLDVSVSMGGMELLVPDGLEVRGAPVAGDTGTLRDADPEVPRPVLEVRTSQSMGEIVFTRR
jgi:hypothetical protein